MEPACLGVILDSSVVIEAAAWDFYVVTTESLNRRFGEVKSLSLRAVRRVTVRCKFYGLKAAVDQILSTSSVKTDKQAVLT